MLKFIITIAITAFVVLFAMDNMDHVDVGLVFGNPKKVRLFYLMATTFLIGFLASHILTLFLQARVRKNRKKMKKIQGMEKDKRRIED